MGKARWIADTVFDWSVSRGSWTETDAPLANRAYHLWQHALALSKNPESEFMRGDAIANLKRALNQRLKTIEAIYYLRRFDLPNKPKGYLEILETVGAVRPALLRHLLDVRNAIEHRDARPPSRKRCAELIDMTWYFLRSTDRMVREATKDLEFRKTDSEGYETPYWFTVTLRYGTRPVLDLHGWFPAELVRTEPAEDNFLIRAETIGTKSSFKDSRGHTDKLETDIWIVGKLAPAPSIARRLLIAALGTNAT